MEKLDKAQIYLNSLLKSLEELKEDGLLNVFVHENEKTLTKARLMVNMETVDLVSDDILDGNLLIAKFMDNWTDMGLEPAYHVYNGKGYQLHEMQFHESFDWQCKALIKIEKGIDDLTNVSEHVLEFLNKQLEQLETSVYSKQTRYSFMIMVELIRFINRINENRAITLLKEMCEDFDFSSTTEQLLGMEPNIVRIKND